MMDDMIQTTGPPCPWCENIRSKSLRKYPAATQHRIAPKSPHHHQQVYAPPCQRQIGYMPPVSALDSPGKCPTRGTGTTTGRRAETDRHTISIDGRMFDDKSFRNKVGGAKSLIHGADSFPNQPKASSVRSKYESEPLLGAFSHCSNRFSHFRAVRGHTPASRAAVSGVRPLSMARTIRSRPMGVNRAFLWTFIRSSSKSLKFHNNSFLDLDRVDSLLKAHS